MTTLLRRADHTQMPWRNGGGTTLEVARHPRSAVDFDWRVSFAFVAGDGPFSAYAGVDRVLTLVEGERMELTMAFAEAPPTRVVLEPGEAFDFPGEVPIMCRVPSPTVDLNVMTRRAVCRAHAQVHQVTSAPVRVEPVPAAQVLVAVLAGSPVLSDGTTLAPLDVLADVTEPLELTGHGRVQVVTITPASGV